MSTNTIEAEVVTDDSPLILAGTGYSLAIAPSYQKKKDELLKHAGMIVTIKDPASDTAADIQIKALAAMRIEVEKSREAKKRPALDFGKLVDTTAKEFVSAITAEEDRVKKLRGDYAAAVLAERNRILREAEAKRQAEEKAKREAEAAAAKAEAERLAAEAAAEEARRKAEEDAFNAVSPEEEAAAAKAAEEAKAKSAALAAAEAARIAAEKAESDRKAAEVVVPEFVPEAPKGVKMVPEYEVLDLDKLYRHDAGLVTLTERRKEILAAIAAGMNGDTPPEIPGLRVFMKPQVR
jgi:hypothetical protein